MTKRRKFGTEFKHEAVDNRSDRPEENLTN